MNRHSSSTGFSLAELSVASTLFLAMVLVVTTLAQSGSEAQDLGRRISNMTEMAQEVCDRMRLELLSSVKVFTDDTEGNANLAVIDRTNAPLPMAALKLPVLLVDGMFRSDTPGDEITGNALFFAELAWRDRFRCSNGNEYVTDVYRWIHYYLSAKDGGPRQGQRGGVDMVRWLSEPLADGLVIDAIVNAVDRAEVLEHMAGKTAGVGGTVRPSVQVVWSRGGDPTVQGTFRQVDPTDGSMSTQPSSRPFPWRILPADNQVTGLLSYQRGSIASNFDIVAPGVTRFAVRDDLAGFPQGFELQFIGQTSARQLLLHLVMVDMTRKGPLAWSQVQTIINCKDR
ncbi:MAG: hypothetical protein WCR59_04055 [Planctomycetota bacterium]|nr:hypothetical protein [Planctomycetota bacterium]